MSLLLDGAATRVIFVLDLDPRRLSVRPIQRIDALRYDAFLIVLDDRGSQARWAYLTSIP